MNNTILTIKSDGLIQEIFKTKNYQYIHRLNNIISRFINNSSTMDYIKSLYTKIKTDSGIYKELIPKYNNYQVDIKFISIKNAKLLNKFNISKIRNYLDFGCGSCESTVHIGKYLRLSKNNIFGCDIKDTFETTWDEKRSKLNNITFGYIKEDGKIPFETSFDLVTCFMVLHHIQNVEDSIKNINRSMNMDGYLYIREHDCDTKYDKYLADILHCLFVYKNNKNDKNIDKNKIEEISNKKCKNMKTYYKSANEWKILFNKYGFKEIYCSPDAGSVTKNYKALYKKIKSI